MLITIGALMIAPARATPIFNSFEPDDTFRQYSGRTVGRGTVYPGGIVTASAFTPEISALFGFLEIAIGYIDGAHQTDVALVSDSGGLPGAVIEQFHFNNIGQFGTGRILLAESTLRPILLAGRQYWVVASAPNRTDWLAWNDSLLRFGPVTQRVGAGAWLNPSPTSVVGAFRVSPVVVPEPSLAWPLLVLLTGGLAFKYRRRH